MGDGLEEQGLRSSVIPPEIAAAIVKIQRGLKPLSRSSSNEEYDSKFTPLPDVMTFALELLNKQGIAVMQSPTTLDGLSALRTILVHKSGVSYEDVTKLALAKVDPQSHASAITYMRRYALMAMLGLTSEDDDDDGNKAAGVHVKPSEDQLERVKSLLTQLRYPPKQIAAEVWKIKTKDHASLAIINFEKIVSMRVRDHEAATAATKIEVQGEGISVITDDDINQDPDSQSLEGRLDALGLANKSFINKFIYSVTDKPFLKNCDAKDRALLMTALNNVDAGVRKLPTEWYPNNKQPSKKGDEA